MNIYHRNTNSRFLLLWLTSFLFIGGFIIFIINGQSLAALLSFGLLFMGWFIKINSLTISEDKISIRRYHAFGFKKRELIIKRENFSEINFWVHDTLESAASTNSWLDIFFIPAFLVAGKKGMSLKVTSDNLESETIRLYLNTKEYDKIRNLM